MECKYTAFDRIINITKKLPENRVDEAVQIIQEDSLIDFLDFCEENNCFTEKQATTLYDFIIIFEDLSSNYHEFDQEKLIRLYDAVGIFDSI